MANQESDIGLLRKSQKLNKGWQWDKHAFIDPEGLGRISLPAYYDALSADARFLIDGVVTDQALKPETTYAAVSNKDGTSTEFLSCVLGDFAYLGFKASLLADESIFLLYPDATSLVLPLKPSMDIKPEFRTYTIQNDLIVPKRNWIYSPASDLSVTLIMEWKLDIVDDIYSVLVPISPAISKTSILLPSIFTNAFWKAYQVDEFPIDNASVVDGGLTWAVDKLRGIFYVSGAGAPVSITVNYTVKPLFSYTPLDYTLPFASFEINEPYSEKFAGISRAASYSM